MRWTIIAMLLCAGCVQHVRPLRQLSKQPVFATAIAWSGDSSLIAYGSFDGIVRVCEVQTGRELASRSDYVMHDMPYESTGLAFSPDGATLAYGSHDGAIRLWNWRGGTTTDLVGHERPLLVAAFSPDGRRLATASGGSGYSPKARG